MRIRMNLGPFQILSGHSHLLFICMKVRWIAFGPRLFGAQGPSYWTGSPLDL